MRIGQPWKTNLIPNFVRSTFLFFYLLVSAACGLSSPPRDTGGSLGGENLARGPENPKIVLFQDDFSDPTSGWDRNNNLGGESDYEFGVYKFLIRQPNVYMWSRPGLQFNDVRIDVQASKISDADISLYGVICRYQDPGNFYFLSITSDGFYGISKFSQNQETLVGMRTMESHKVINQQVATNHLTAECIGDRLRLAVNGIILADVQDGDFLTGDVGLIAGSMNLPNGEILFDNLTVLSP
jgi:hypothetical protein